MPFKVTQFRGEWSCDWCGWVEIAKSVEEADLPPAYWRRLVFATFDDSNGSAETAWLCSLCGMRVSGALMDARGKAMHRGRG